MNTAEFASLARYPLTQFLADCDNGVRKVPAYVATRDLLADFKRDRWGAGVKRDFRDKPLDAQKFVREFAQVVNGIILKTCGVEKAAIVITASVVYKLGYRAPVEARTYAQANAVMRASLAMCVELTPWLAAMERVIVWEHTGYDGSTLEREYGPEFSAQYKALNKITRDLHGGNYGITRDGRLVLLDYSFER